jgi:hypothetical protein
MLTSFLFPETPMSPRMPSGVKIRGRPRLVAPLRPLCRPRLTLPAPSNIRIRIHILRHNHLHLFRQASRHRAHRSATCIIIITCRHNSKRRPKTTRIPINHHRTQRARKKSSIILKGRMSSPRVPSRLKRLLARLLCRRPILTIKGTKC